jgi:hypothetical protein
MKDHEILSIHSDDARNLLATDISPATNTRSHRLRKGVGFAIPPHASSVVWLTPFTGQLCRSAADLTLLDTRDRPRGAQNGRMPNEVAHIECAQTYKAPQCRLGKSSNRKEKLPRPTLHPTSLSAPEPEP